MRRSKHLFILLPLLLVVFVGCRRGRVAAGSVTIVPAATIVATSVPVPSADPTFVATATPASLIDGAPTRTDSEAAVQAVAVLLERKVPTFPATRPLSGPTPERDDRPNQQDGDSALVLPTPTPAPDDGKTGPGESNQRLDGEVAGEVNASVVNVRSGPGTAYSIAGQVQRAEEVTVTGRTSDSLWLQICCPVAGDEQNWIAADFLDVRLPQGNALDDLPIVEAPPVPESAAASVAAAAPAPGAGSAVGLPAPGGFPAPGANNPLTGQPLPSGRSGQRPIIVCINNDFAARPQLGTSQADVMYEYLMEGYGITRFSGVYYGGSSGQIGPVRSARLINYYMGALYDAGLVCSGASDRVRYMLKHEAPFPYLDIDLDDPSNARYSASIGTDYRTRMRTGTDKLRRWLADWEVEKPAAIRGFTFGGVPGGGVPATSINIPYPNGQVAYRYDGGSGRYLRSMSGGAHVDGNTGAQLALDNVIVQFVPHQATDIVEDSLGSTSIRLDLFGSGRAIVFRDGQAFEGTWRSESRGDMPRFYATSGAEVPLKPGRSWISVVPAGYGVTYQ